MAQAAGVNQGPPGQQPGHHGGPPQKQDGSDSGPPQQQPQGPPGLLKYSLLCLYLIETIIYEQIIV